MGMWASSAFSTGAFGIIKSNVTAIIVCTTQPASASSAYDVALAKSTVTSSTFTVSTGDVSGFKLNVAAFSNLTVNTSGSADHIALCTSSDGTLYYVTTCNSKNLTTADTVTIPTWDIELRDPTSS